MAVLFPVKSIPEERVPANGQRFTNEEIQALVGNLGGNILATECEFEGDAAIAYHRVQHAMNQDLNMFAEAELKHEFFGNVLVVLPDEKPEE